MLKLLARLLTMSAAATALIAQSDSALDFEVFKTRIQPVFLAKRPGHARCYVCHSTATNFRLQRLSPGAAALQLASAHRASAASALIVVIIVRMAS